MRVSTAAMVAKQFKNYICMILYNGLKFILNLTNSNQLVQKLLWEGIMTKHPKDQYTCSCLHIYQTGFHRAEFQ